MLDSTLNTTNLRNAFKCAAPQFGMNGTVTPQPMESSPHVLPHQSKVHLHRTPTSTHRPQFMRGLDRGH